MTSASMFSIKILLLVLLAAPLSSSFYLSLPQPRRRHSCTLKPLSLSMASLSDPALLSTVQLQLAKLLPQLLTGSLVYGSLTFYFDRPRGEMLIDDDALIKKSSNIPNAGLGLFAARDLPKGTNLGLYPGVLTPTNAYRNKKLQTHPESVSYVWKLQNVPGSLEERGVLDPTDSEGIISDYCSGGSTTIPLSRFLFRTVFATYRKPTTLCRINEPLTPEDANVDSTEETEAGKVLFFISRDVVAGEELYLYYGEYYDRSGYGQ
ncbi:hypothetical protein TrST_g3873 [Triparma strigata]|uniref:SET domain-containing protein n=1 Tax=Triparma strigata TaxID=1606541 RepID=A0A9W7BMT8_9STRA|nr:hypothetical protein TrST_g3873 [Triparma strigata]